MICEICGALCQPVQLYENLHWDGISPESCRIWINPPDVEHDNLELFYTVEQLSKFIGRWIQVCYFCWWRHYFGNNRHPRWRFPTEEQIQQRRLSK